MSKSPEELYQERKKRYEDAVALRVPDRVPVSIQWGFFPARYVGITCEEYMYDYEKALNASIKAHEDFAPDVAESPYSTRVIGNVLDAIGFEQLRWAGRGLDANAPYQFVEGEYMPPEEYDHFIEDPTDWVIRKYWPRVCSKLEGFGNIGPLKNMISYYFGIPFGFAPFGTEEGQQALEALKNAGKASLEAVTYAGKFGQEMAKRGFPMRDGGSTQAPFDTLGDFFRGTRGIMMDMYRRPEKLLKALDVLTPWMVKMGVAGGKKTGNPRIFIPLHKGSDSFMSDEQFKTFYWPSLQKLIIALVDEGMNPSLFVEADHTSRLEVMRDVPAGKVIYHMENTDMFKAKEILGDRVCLRGNVPISMLCLGTPDDVKAYCKKLIDVVGKNGGLIMDSSVGIEDAKVENIKAMIDFTKEYGVYR
jgi:uroporphyrinogen-III decarboxylase